MSIKVMSPAQQKEAMEWRAQRILYLDQRVPELHAMGKAQIRMGAQPTAKQRLASIGLMCKVGTYKGRDAATIALAEFHRGARAKPNAKPKPKP